ncbi:monovalent cation/H(+) antiporter subunit G [Pseudoalteromonas denitrificans]|uniref:Multisubunit sodium/proton antiporter, MrpG subunit n=1 Tax=Pseudoalteromonas denitrificans DSM 6059 TaxID=1123010 RepID=A0A1I1S7Y3_9GAMM|nr:monovalent cation/H(+) antiporter subunit G [Pseudoalteromonas denitrificans]SFD42611.1 multisubunit sodium/proton antiporter, MrpG subunit [Pseudoalteromonas denitrificans DSM 6059]
MEIVITISSGFLLLVGSFLCISGGIGLLRFPDFYTRMHAVGVTDTLGAGMILAGLMILSTDFLVFAKLVMILLFTLLIGPTTSHVLAKAAFHNGVIPKGSNNLKQTKEKESTSSII